MKKYIVYVYVDEVSKSPVIEKDTLDECNIYIDGNPGPQYSIEMHDEFGSTIIS